MVLLQTLINMALGRSTYCVMELLSAIYDVLAVCFYDLFHVGSLDFDISLVVVVVASRKQLVLSAWSLKDMLAATLKCLYYGVPVVKGDWHAEDINVYRVAGAPDDTG